MPDLSDQWGRAKETARNAGLQSEPSCMGRVAVPAVVLLVLWKAVR